MHPPSLPEAFQLTAAQLGWSLEQQFDAVLRFIRLDGRDGWSRTDARFLDWLSLKVKRARQRHGNAGDGTGRFLLRFDEHTNADTGADSDDASRGFRSKPAT